MCKARFTEDQVVTVIKSVEAGRTVKDICWEDDISEAPTTTGSPNTVAFYLGYGPDSKQLQCRK